jgi:hypothetical protein
MLARVAAGELPLALARRVLAVLIAAALAFAPVGAAMAAHAPGHMTHALHHDHAAMQLAVADQKGAKHCAGKTTRTCCCDDEGACAQTCLQKCFGQMAVMPPERTARMALAFRIAPRLAKRPPGWSSAPQLPPPRA